MFTQDDAEWIYNEGDGRSHEDWAALTAPAAGGAGQAGTLWGSDGFGEWW